MDKVVEILGKCDQTHYNLKTTSGKRGIYLREPHQVNSKQTIALTVRPQHPKNLPNEDIVKFEKHCIIKNGHSWISAPQFLHLSSGEKAFAVEVDPTQIQVLVHFDKYRASTISLHFKMCKNLLRMC